MQSSDEWGQNYINTLPELSFDVTDLPPCPTAATLSPKVSANGDALFPRGSIGKPVRRRSRASKKSPTTTLLTADANSFRALVQQFTGCHSTPPAFGPYKGPINLNFERSSDFLEKPEGLSDRSLFSFGGNNTITTTATTTTDVGGYGGLVVSGVNDDRRPESLNFDDFNVDDLSMGEMSVTGDCSAALPGGKRDDDFWGY